MKTAHGYREENVLNTEELLPVISFNAKTSTDEQKKHDDFVDRMMEKATPVNRCVYCANGICAYVNRLNNQPGTHATGPTTTASK